MSRWALGRAWGLASALLLEQGLEWGREWVSQQVWEPALVQGWESDLEGVLASAWGWERLIRTGYSQPREPALR